MVRILRLRVYVEGLEHSYKTEGVEPICTKGFPTAAALAFIRRATTELLSPNSRSEHNCGIDCKKTYGILIGRTDTTQDSLSLIDAIPR